MADVYEGEVSKRDLPGGFSSEIQTLVVFAVSVGWKLIVTSGSGMTIVAPNERKKYHFSTRRKSGPVQRIRKDILKFGDPTRLAFLGELRDSTATDQQFTEAAAVLLEGADIEFKMPEDEKEAPVPAKKTAKKAAKRTGPGAAREAGRQLGKQIAASERTIVSTKPMVAKAGEGRAYESKVAVERTWSDGFVDYQCTLCDYSGTRLSVRGHWQMHVRKGEAERTKRNPDFAAEVPAAAHYAPRRTRIEALAAEIAKLMQAGETDAEVIAKTALTWVHEQSCKGNDLAAEREELTPEDTLNRIRTLLDQGTYENQRREIDRLAAEVANLQYMVLAEQEKAERVRENFKAFRELAMEFTDEKEADESRQEEEA